MSKPLALAVSGMFQVAYVVPDLRAGIQQCDRVFGTEHFLTFTDIAFEDALYRGLPSSARQHVAFGFSGLTNLEVIEPIYGDSIYSEFLANHPKGGLHHLAYKVADFKAAHEEMSRDFEEVQSGRFGTGTRFSYFDTLAAVGHVTELLYFDDETNALFERLKAGDLPEASGLNAQ